MAVKEKRRDPRAWSSVKLPPWIHSFVESMGYPKMTAVQAAVLPQFLQRGTDVVVEAVTGSGKTLAFLLPVVQKLLSAEQPLKPRHVGAVIISPTRELASQIHSVLLSLLEFHPPSAEILPHLKEEEKRPTTSEPVIVPQLLVGGTNTPAQDLSFFMRHSPTVIIATPGRLAELLSSPYVLCPQSSFEVLVLDEADRLLDLGFQDDLRRILSFLPKQRRTGLFSASVSEAVGELIRVGLRNPVKISVRVKSLTTGGIVEDRKTPASLQMLYMVGPPSHKLPSLMHLLRDLDPRPARSIIFLSTCAAVDYFSHVLPALLPPGFTLIPLHGKHPANVRQKNFNRFLTSVSPTILLTTDVASRGLDVPQVDLVVQVDPPTDPKVFIHRAGRAGRAGRRGLAVVLLHKGHEENYVEFLEIRQTPIRPLKKPVVEISDEDAASATETIRKIVHGDRAIHDKAQRAFVSWVRSYKAHQAASIFQLDLDWEELGRAWGLLRLPRMPELKGWEGDRFIVPGIDWDAYAYKDKAREKARKEALEEAAEAEENGTTAANIEKAKKKRKNNEAWSEQTDRDGVRAERRDKRRRKREAERESQMTEEEKVEKRKLDEMIAEIRRKNQQAEESRKSGGDEFEGFDD